VAIGNSLEDTNLEQAATKLKQRVEELGLSVFDDTDFANLAAHLRSQGAIINPTFDPAEHSINEGFWLKVLDAEGRIIGCHAERVFRTPDFIDHLIEGGRLWWSKSKPPAATVWRGKITPPSCRISGAVAYAGSMLISPAFRGIGLSKTLPLLSRALILKNHKTDFHTGIVRHALASTKVPRSNYGFTHVDAIFTGVLPGVTGAPEEVFLCWMNRADSISTVT
jgi:hypothetical protein